MTVSMDEARRIISDRIEEAAETLKRMPDHERARLRKGERGQAWPAMLHQASEHAAYQGLKLRLPPPSAARITRMNAVLDWLVALAKVEPSYCRVVWLMNAERLGPSKVARVVGIHRETADRWNKAGLTLIAVKFSKAAD